MKVFELKQYLESVLDDLEEYDDQEEFDYYEDIDGIEEILKKTKHPIILPNGVVDIS